MGTGPTRPDSLGQAAIMTAITCPAELVHPASSSDATSRLVIEYSSFQWLIFKIQPPSDAHRWHEYCIPERRHTLRETSILGVLLTVDQLTLKASMSTQWTV